MKKQILTIDDKKEIRRLLQIYLSEKYEVITMRNGLEAFGFLQQGNVPDAIISDIQMPGIDGYEFLKQLRISSVFEKVPVIMLSSLSDSSEKVQFLKNGANDYLVKPFNPAELEARLDILLQEAETK